MTLFFSFRVSRVTVFTGDFLTDGGVFLFEYDELLLEDEAEEDECFLRDEELYEDLEDLEEDDDWEEEEEDEEEWEEEEDDFEVDELDEDEREEDLTGEEDLTELSSDNSIRAGFGGNMESIGFTENELLRTVLLVVVSSSSSNPNCLRSRDCDSETKFDIIKFMCYHQMK